MRMSRARALRIIDQGRAINDDLMAMAESPIEELFLAVWLQHVSSDLIEVQATCRPYRLDFLIYGPHGRIAVECDGIEFHRGGSVERARADVRRDRYILTRHGIPTMRFMGTEIASDPHSCVAEACRAAGLPAPDLVTGQVNLLLG